MKKLTKPEEWTAFHRAIEARSEARAALRTAANAVDEARAAHKKAVAAHDKADAEVGAAHKVVWADYAKD